MYRKASNKVRDLISLALNNIPVQARKITVRKSIRNAKPTLLLEFAQRINVSGLARSGFELISSLAQKYWLVPFEQLKSGQFVEASSDQKLICYLMSGYGGLTCMFKLLATANLALRSSFDLRLVLCMGSFFSTFSSWLPSFAFLFLQNESVAWLNSVLSALENLDRKCGNTQKRDLFTDVVTSLKIIYFTTLPVLVPLANVISMILFTDLPLSWIGFAVSVGLAPQSGYVYVGGYVLSMIIEAVTSCLQWLTVSLVTQIGFLTVKLLHVYIEDIG